MNETQFIDMVKTGAILSYRKYSVLPSLTIAQAILESGWGKSGLARNANNLFGIKTSTSWRGEKVSLETTEYTRTNKKYTIVADFRKYNNIEDSILDHALILMNDRYAKVIRTTNYKIACYEVWKAGYATEPKYPELLINIIEQYNLNKIDEYVLNDKTYKKITEVFNNMNIFKVQELLNKWGITDKNNKPLNVDGKQGELTDSAILKAKELLNYILK